MSAEPFDRRGFLKTAGGVAAGAPVATNTAMTLRPAGRGTATNNWIGRSRFADPFLSATVADFHIDDRALDASQIAAPSGGRQGADNVAAYRFDNVAAYRFDEDGGATAVEVSGNGRDATITSHLARRQCPPRRNRGSARRLAAAGRAGDRTGAADRADHLDHHGAHDLTTYGSTAQRLNGSMRIGART